MPAVAGDQDEVALDRRRRDPDIRVTNQHAALPELAPDAGEALHRAPGHREHADAVEELPQSLLLAHGITAIVDAFVDLAEGDDADGETGPRQRRQGVAY